MHRTHHRGKGPHAPSPAGSRAPPANPPGQIHVAFPALTTCSPSEVSPQYPKNPLTKETAARASALSKRASLSRTDAPGTLRRRRPRGPGRRERSAASLRPHRRHGPGRLQAGPAETRHPAGSGMAPAAPSACTWGRRRRQAPPRSGTPTAVRAGGRAPRKPPPGPKVIQHLRARAPRDHGERPRPGPAPRPCRPGPPPARGPPAASAPPLPGRSPSASTAFSPSVLQAPRPPPPQQPRPLGPGLPGPLSSPAPRPPPRQPSWPSSAPGPPGTHRRCGAA